MAGYKKKRARELQHDRFRDTAIGVFDRLGDLLEGRGKAILYGIAAVLLIAILVGVWVTWSRRKADEAHRALGRGIAIASTPVSSTSPLDPASSYANEQERAQKAIEEFQKVVAKYGDPYQTKARYFIATSLLYVDREKGISELAELGKSKSSDIATLARFALAQAKEADGKYDEAAQLYSQILSQNSGIITPETGNLRLAMVYQKQGKKKEAADILFRIVDDARKSKDTEGATLPLSGAAREASQKLQKLDPDRFAQLPAESPAAGLTF
ncbi:MAG: tetratricopeptide repeat protein [Acidobacteriota bacterium]|nr:tetratricopeptide repeat protein [Acidobacteriota bacterium]